MANSSGRTLTSKESMEINGISLSDEYIQIAKKLLTEIIELQNMMFSGDRSLKISKCTAKNVLLDHNIGMAFECLYKTTILIENGKYENEHKIHLLHKELTKRSQELFQTIITDHGWKSRQQFEQYVNTLLTNPGRKYFEGDPVKAMSVFQNPKKYHYDLTQSYSFIDLYNKLRHIVSIIASNNEKTLFPEGIIIKNKYLTF